MKIKQELLESLIRVCAKEVLAQLNESKKSKGKTKVIFGKKNKKEVNENDDDNTDNEGSNDGVVHKTKKIQKDVNEDETIGAGAPPIETGNVDLPQIPNDKTPIDSTPSEPETPKKKEKLKGIVLYTPSGDLRAVPFKQWADDASIERTLHRVGASIGGDSVKIAIQTMRKVKSGVNDKTPTYIYIGKYDPNGEELFVFADRNLDVAKEESIKPEEKTTDNELDATELSDRDKEVQNDDELLAKHLAGDDKPNIDREIGFDDSESGQD